MSTWVRLYCSAHTGLGHVVQHAKRARQVSRLRVAPRQRHICVPVGRDACKAMQNVVEVSCFSDAMRSKPVDGFAAAAGAPACNNA